MTARVHTGRKKRFQFRPRHFGMCECLFQFRLWSINVETLSLNLAFSPVFVNCNSNSSVTVAEHETAISYIGIQFRQSFNQIRPPGVKAQ